MTTTRFVILMIGFAALGIAVVALRAHQADRLRRVQDLQFRQTELEREILRQEMELARLRSPEMIRERHERFQRHGEVSLRSDEQETWSAQR